MVCDGSLAAVCLTKWSQMEKQGRKSALNGIFQYFNGKYTKKMSFPIKIVSFRKFSAIVSWLNGFESFKLCHIALKLMKTKP
jgi:hypothetical protein